MNKNKNTRKAFLHLLAWGAAFAINIILLQGYSFRINWSNTLISWAFYVFVFYINYLVLIPRLLKRRGLLYLICALMVLSVSFVAIKHTAIESARKNAQVLSERLLSYPEVKESFDEKERLRERQREIKHQREHEQQIRAGEQADNRGGMPLSLGRPPGKEFRGFGGGQNIYHPERFRASLDSLMLDSLFRQIRQEQDSFLAVAITYTPAEEEYSLLRREEGQARWHTRRLVRGGFNPFSLDNLQFVFALIFFYMASIVVFFAEQSGRAEKRRREMEKEKANAELAYLKQQINPHFLFNTLNSIYSYTIGVSEEASDTVLKLSSILRYMLYETNRDRVPLADELAVLDNYIDLQRLRTTEKTEIGVVVEGDTHLRRIEPMLLIPIVENAFKYGVDSVEPSFVRIEAAVKGHDFMFRATNKVVRRSDGDPSNSGIGLVNIRRRLDLIYGPGNYELKAGEKNGIFSVTLRLNLKD